MLPRTNQKLSAIGIEGLATLLFSNLLIIVTLGVTLLLAWIYVVRVAHASPISPSGRVWIIVPGMRLRKNQPGADFTRRLQRAYQLFDNGAGDRIIILGGMVGANSLSEAAAGREYLMRRGVPESRILLEQRSRNTFQNFCFAKAEIAHIGQTETVIVSSRYHLARCGLMANCVKIKHQLCAAEDRLQWSRGLLLKLLKEAYYLHCYLCGRCWSIATGRKTNVHQC